MYVKYFEVCNKRCYRFKTRLGELGEGVRESQAAAVFDVNKPMTFYRSCNFVVLQQVVCRVDIKFHTW